MNSEGKKSELQDVNLEFREKYSKWRNVNEFREIFFQNCEGKKVLNCEIKQLQLPFYIFILRHQ